MSYSKNLLHVVRIKDRATADTSFRADTTMADNETGSTEDVPVSTLTATKGYARGEQGEQSIDPSTATAGFREYTNSTMASSFLTKGDYIEVDYDGFFVFAGLVRQVDVEVEPVTAQLGNERKYQRSIRYQFASSEHLYLSTRVSWEYLPEESAIDRLSRWFNVTVYMNDSHLAQLSVMMPSEDYVGSKALLDILRDFSAATKLPVRLVTDGSYRAVEVFDSTVPWTDAPLYPPPSFDDASLFTSAVSYENGVPSAVTLVKNYTDFTVFIPPKAVDIFGFTVPLMKLTQSFGTEYEASFELDPEAGGDALAADETTQIVPILTPPPKPVSVAPGATTWLPVPPNDGDATGILQAAIDNAAANGGGTVGLLGWYHVKGLIGRPGVSIVGIGDSACGLIVSGEKSAINCTSESEIVGSFRYSDFGVICDGSGSNAAIEVGTTGGAGANPTDYVRFERLNIRGAGGPGIWCRGWIVSSLRDIVVTDCQGGFFIDGTYSWVTSTNLYNCYANATGDYGYKFVHATYVGGMGLATDSAEVGYELYNVSAAAFTNCGAEGTTSEGWIIDGGPHANLDVDQSVIYGSTAVSLVSCYSTETGADAYLWKGYSSGAMFASRAFSSAGSPPPSLTVESPAAVTSLQNTFNSSVGGTGSRAFYDAVDAEGNPIGITNGPDSPHLFGWSDSIQAVNRGDVANPVMVLKGMSGQTGSLLRAVADDGTNKVSLNPQGDGQIAFGTDESVTITRVGDGLAAAPMKLGIFATGAALEAAYPAASYYGYSATVEDWIVSGTHYGMKTAVSDGVSWKADAQYSQPHD